MRFQLRYHLACVFPALYILRALHLPRPVVISRLNGLKCAEIGDNALTDLPVFPDALHEVAIRPALYVLDSDEWHSKTVSG